MAICAQVGRRGHGHRRGDRRRHADHDLARRHGRQASRRGPPPTARSTSGRWPARTDLDALQASGPEGLARPKDGPALRETLLTLLGSPGLADKSWVTAQYDSWSAATPCSRCRKTAAWSGSTRRPGSASRSPPTATAGTARLDPYQGTQLALARGLPQRRDDRRRAGRGDQLPELRLPRRPGRHVAARRGRPRASPTAASTSASRSPAATSASTTRPAPPRSTRPR